jgi:hypothetical protein
MREFHGAARALRRALVVLLVVGASDVGLSSSGRADDAADRLRDLRVVSSAIRLEGQCLGFACTPSLYYAAYARIVGTSDLTLDQILEAYDRALPAGRVYLSAVILKRDRARGEEVLRELTKSSALVWKQYGCVVDFTTAGSAATFVLANNGLPGSW